MQSTDYSGYVSNWETGGDAVYCPASLSVREQDSGCPIGMELVNGVCIQRDDNDDDGNSDDTQQCPPNQHLQGGICVGNTSNDDTNDEENCPIGYVNQGNTCVFASCPVGFVKIGVQCVFTGCPLGYVEQGGACVWSGCPANFTQQGNQCVMPNQCTDAPYCQGKHLYNGCTDEIIESCAYGCAYGCAGGRCNGVPKASATLKANPVVLVKGKTSVISWTSQNTSACTVTGTNGDNWSGLSSEGKTTKPILGQVIFKLHCSALPGASPSFVEKSVSVNIVPDFVEK